MKRLRVTVLIAAAAFSLVVVGFVLAHGPLTTLNELQTLSWPQKFSVQAWREHPDERYWMAIDLVQSGALRHKTREWVDSSLGAPASSSPDRADWPVPSPQRPDDMLVVGFANGEVANWMVTSDPLGGEPSR